MESLAPVCVGYEVVRSATHLASAEWRCSTPPQLLLGVAHTRK